MRYVFLFAVFVCARSGAAENWPAWRGPRGDGVSQETNLPVVWNSTTGLVWKADLPEWGDSTPAVWERSIFLTAQQDNDLLVLKLDVANGNVEWTRKLASAVVERKGPPREKKKFHDLHNLASPSPVTDGATVVVHFGNGELAAYDFGGKLQWRRNLQDDHGQYTIWWGHANSPVLYKNLVISVCMQDSLADKGDKPVASYLVAHDLKTGEEQWKTLRMTGAAAEQCDAYTTPVVYDAGGRAQLIVMGGNQLDAYSPADGKQLWYLPGLTGGRTVTGPTVADGLVFATHGMRGPLLAVKLGGQGKLSSGDVVWKYDQGTPDTPCPVVWRDLVFTVADDGVARAIDIPSGKMRWKQRLKGDYKASPVAAEGRIYFLNTAGVCTVAAASDRFEKLAENNLPDTTLASPAISGGRILIRGKKALYCVVKAPAAAE